MGNKLKPGHEGQPPPEGAEDERVHEGDARNAWQGGEEAYPGGGVNGPVKEDRHGYQTHYGETAYGGGQKRYGSQKKFDQTVHGGQQGVHGTDQPADPGFFSGKGHSDAGATEEQVRSEPGMEGHAGSKATLPGAGADTGPPDGK